MSFKRNILISKYKTLFILGVLNLSLLTGCSTFSTNTPMNKLEPIDPRQQVIYCPASLIDLTKQSIELESKISITTNTNRWFGKIKWSHSPNQDEFEILSPLGQTISKIKLNKDGVTLNDGKNTYHALTPEELTLRALGLKIPVSGIVYWLVGQSYPYSPSTPQKNAKGEMQQLNQAGWTIYYLDEYAPAGRYLMPHTLEINGQDQQSNQTIKIKILNQIWNIK